MADRQENLFDRINNLQKHIDELEEQLSEVLKRKVEEAAESQTKELSSNIMSTQSLIKDEARNLADNARSSTEQIATLVSVAGKQTDAAIAEAVERMISDAAKNQKASESRDDANRANQEKAQLQIRNMIEKTLVYNTFYVGENCDITIIAGCGIHNDSHDASEHDGIHSFYLGKNSRVRYVVVEKFMKLW